MSLGHRDRDRALGARRYIEYGQYPIDSNFIYWNFGSAMTATSIKRTLLNIYIHLNASAASLKCGSPNPTSRTDKMQNAHMQTLL